MYGDGNAISFDARMLDPRLGRWLSIDPLAYKYPAFSPYSFVANNPIIAIDPDGKKIVLYYVDRNGEQQKVKIKRMSQLDKLKEIDNDFVQDFHKSIDYLTANGADYGKIKDVIESKKRVNIKSSKERSADGSPSPNRKNPEIGGSEVGSTYDPTTSTIYWDNINALAFSVEITPGHSTTTKASPAFTLLSEFGKAWFMKKGNYVIPKLSTGLGLNDNSLILKEKVGFEDVVEAVEKLEEKVLTEVEQPASTILGEGYRIKWKGVPFQIYKSEGATSNQPKNKGEGDKVEEFEKKNK